MSLDWRFLPSLGFAAVGLFVSGFFILSVRGGSSMAPPRVVDRVDLNRYTGTWFEIARYPNRFQKNCAGATATYTLRPDGKIEVINRCRDKSLTGKLRQVKGSAWVVDRKTNARLKVRFFWPFSGDYWIIELDPDYRWAVVGHPERSYLWILSRTPTLDPATYQDILRRIEAQGYSLQPLLVTPQVPEPAKG